MTTPFFDQPILNSPYAVPTRHHALDTNGQPLSLPPLEGRRSSRYVAPVPPPRKQTAKSRQAALALGDDSGLSTDTQAYNPTPIINEIRGHVTAWRDLRNPADWGVKPSRSVFCSTGAGRRDGRDRSPSSAK